LTTTCGTPGYMAPEIFKKSGHGKPVDVWAIGVITYFLLCGYTPFDRDSNLEEMQAILVADYSFTPIEYWRGVSQSARRFIQRCLTIDATKRMTAHEALSHEWIAGPEGGRGEEDLLPTVKKNFNARRTLHKAIDTVRAINQLRAGGLGMMDGAQSTNPKRFNEVVEAAKPKDENVNEDVDMKDVGDGPSDGTHDSGVVMDPRGHGHGQTDEQIAEQQRRIEETTMDNWNRRRAAQAT
jgi:calcium/calmodulin-dependent protein kinase I